MQTELENLDKNENYWIVLAGDKADSRNIVYDCKAMIIKRLVQWSKGPFYIVDKKYGWLTFFKRSEFAIELYRSGSKRTPWDIK